MATVYLAFGSNIGDRQANIDRAIQMLQDNGVSIEQISSILETDPVGGPPDQGLFLNGALRATTDLSPHELLKLAKRIEKGLGRVKTVQDGPRPIDIDILLYDDIQLNTEDLIIPHQRMYDRDFVMIPLREINTAFIERTGS